MLQHGCTLKTVCSLKEARHKRTHFVTFYLYEMPRISKSIETERLVDPRGWETIG